MFEYEGSHKQKQDVWYKRMQDKYGKDHTFFDLSDVEAEEYGVLKKKTREEYSNSIRLGGETI